MKLSFLFGVVIAIAAHLIGFLSNDYNITLKITGFVVSGSFIITCTLNGTFFNDYRHRGNYINETKDDREKKNRIIKHLVFLSIPSVIISIAILSKQTYFI